MRPLEGITVVSLEHAVAAPFATRQLADLGARVIKIERPESGDFARSYDDRVEGLSANFFWCNRSKESVALNLKSKLGQEALLRLVARADVFIQNLAPGAAARMGYDYDALREKYPGLIVCDISGYGLGGPYQDRKAYDVLIQSESGFLSVTGTPDAMAKAGCSIADIAAGMYAYSNILVALFERKNTGKGRHIDVSMLEAMAEWMSFPLYYAYGGAKQPGRAGASHATIFPYGPFPVADGQVILGIQNEREWVSFCNMVLGQPALSGDPRFADNSSRSANRAELTTIIECVFGRMSKAQAIKKLEEAKIANAAVNDMAGLWTHPQLLARERWINIETPAGVVPALLPPGQKDARMDPVPRLGADTARILEEIGLSDPRTEAGYAA